MARPIRWLHLSDLHLGCRGKELWWTAQPAFEKSIRQMVGRRGAPDLVLFTGDLVNTGQAAQFKQLDQFLVDLFGWMRDEDSTTKPVLVPVPGNHDVQRPQGLKARAFSWLAEYGTGETNEDTQLLHDELWREKRPSASQVKPLFKNYQSWFRRSALPQLRKAGEFHLSHFPGDFTLRIEPEGAFPLVLVGLNATWQQYRAGDFERKLRVPREQFFAALPKTDGGSPLGIFQDRQRALLLMHQPPSWLSPANLRNFNQTIYPPGRFDLCLHGHLHEAESRAISIGGGKIRRYFQAASLFGMDHWGDEQERSEIGYSWGELSENGALRLWPMRHLLKLDGSATLEFDQRFHGKPRWGVQLTTGKRKSKKTPAKRQEKSAASLQINFTSYLRDLIDRTQHLSIRGLSYKPGSVKRAEQHRIEKLYIPLRAPQAVSDAIGIDPETAESPGELMANRHHGSEEERSVALAELLPNHPRLLIEGAPGSGKTTFLHFVACMLARDRMGVPTDPKGGSWRQQYLGLDSSVALLPVLVRISQLADLLADPKAPRLRYDNRTWLLELLARTSQDNGYSLTKKQWDQTLASGEAILLLDGLDEVADDRLRQRIFKIVCNGCQHWRKCPMVVTSRPMGTQALIDHGFAKVTVAPFSAEQIQTFIAHWVATLEGVERPSALRGEGRKKQLELENAVLPRPRIRKMATNPVMLTCLCVVHWNEGKLPDGRSKVYLAVLRWLIAAREQQREEHHLTKSFAWEGFDHLAFSMMASPNGKVAQIDIAEAIKAVKPVLDREFPDLSTRARRAKAEEWLRFESLGSGIIEELPGNRLKFWHLTFQEYLAARRLVHREEDWWPEVRQHLGDEQWRETIEMLPGCLHEGGRKGPDRLLREIANLRASDSSLPTTARVVASLGLMLQALQPYEYKAEPTLTSAFAEAREECLSIFTPEGASEVPIKLRLEAARVLGRYGDPRLAEDQDNFLAVPGLDGLRLGRYPVTVEEYARFVDDGGYTQAAWWGEYWSWKQSEGLLEPGVWQSQLQTPNHPVIGVSWYEAHAYCAWLTDRLGKVVARLPSDEEWEKAATPEKGEFPWGGAEPTAELANYGGDVGGPSPVGLYPGGNGPNSHCDLAGNVWEWCEDARNDLGFNESEDAHSRRGGSWAAPAGSLRSADRGWFPARHRNVYFGFRVAVVPASP